MRPALPLAALSVLLLAVLLPAPPLGAQDTRTTQDGIYTADQAQRGKQVYVQVCSECHPLDWYQGDIMRAWEGAPISIFFQIIQTTMPKSNPGSLPRKDYVDMLAYILELNGMPPGEESLSSRSSTLRNILFRWSDAS
jgi:mono/diheme cytochrome c family protein